MPTPVKSRVKILLDKNVYYRLLLMTMPILIVNFVIMGMVELMDVTFMAKKLSKVFC